jgi:hypothetical protein
MSHILNPGLPLLIARLEKNSGSLFRQLRRGTNTWAIVNLQVRFFPAPFNKAARCVMFKLFQNQFDWKEWILEGRFR